MFRYAVFEIILFLKGRIMKVIQQFDDHHGSWLTAVQKENTEVARLSNRLSLPGYQLYEVWLMDENMQMLSPALLKKICFNSVEELSLFYRPDKSPEPFHAASRELDLVREIGIGLRLPDTCFHHSVVSTPHGPVASIVFGSCKAMTRMYEEGLRERMVPVAEDESSN